MVGFAGKDPDAVLDEWAARESHQAFAAWLRGQASADQRHAIAYDWNWDAGEEVLYWIVTRPDCDRATALTIFWLGSPAYFLEFAFDRSKVQPYFLNNFDLLAEIRERWQRGAYSRAELTYDDLDLEDQRRSASIGRAEHGDLYERFIPSEMILHLPGRSAASEPLQEGIPLRFLKDE